MKGIPSILSADQIAAVLELAGQDGSPLGLRDHAILQLLANYGLRSGEVGRLRIEDINWRAAVKLYRGLCVTGVSCLRFMQQEPMSA